MQLAINLGQNAHFQAPPNPWVGCVIVKNNSIIGQGWTQRPGQAHAEVMALHQAQSQAKGATLFVSLEPCSHYGRTPPCSKAIIEAGIEEVYVAQLDPDLQVQGKGIQQLREAGIKVHVGLGEEEAKRNLVPYLYQRTTGLPYTILKAAISLDGRMAASDKNSKWITSQKAREDSHYLRASSQAIVVGSGTAEKDLPQLTVRLPELSLPQQPLRVVLDATGKVKPQGPLFDRNLAPTAILTTERCPTSIITDWKNAGVHVYVVPGEDTHVDLMAAWKLLGSLGILQALVEGGSQLHTALLKTSLVNQLTLYMGPILIGSKGLPLFDTPLSSLAESPSFSLNQVKQIDDCVRIDYSTNNKKLFK